MSMAPNDDDIRLDKIVAKYKLELTNSEEKHERLQEKLREVRYRLKHGKHDGSPLCKPDSVMIKDALELLEEIIE